MYGCILRALMLALQYLCDLLQENPICSLNLGMSLFTRNLSSYKYCSYPHQVGSFSCASRYTSSHCHCSLYLLLRRNCCSQWGCLNAHSWSCSSAAVPAFQRQLAGCLSSWSWKIRQVVTIKWQKTNITYILRHLRLVMRKSTWVVVCPSCQSFVKKGLRTWGLVSPGWRVSTVLGEVKRFGSPNMISRLIKLNERAVIEMPASH